MKIKLSLSALNEALDRVSVVKAFTGSSKIEAYLFTVKEGRCHIHSMNLDTMASRVEVPILESDSDFSFAYPSDRVAAFKTLDGWIEIEAGNTDTGFWVKYLTEGGASAERSTFSYKGLNTVDIPDETLAKTMVFSTAVLKEALNTAAEPIETNRASNDSESSHLQTVQLFDTSQDDWAKGDGTCFGTNDGNRSNYFHSPSLMGKGFAIHALKLGTFISFLNKCGKSVKIAVGDGKTYAIDQVVGEGGEVKDGAVFVWSQHKKLHGKYRYVGAKQDKLVLLTPRELILKALRQVRLEMQDANQNKIRLVYSNGTIRFLGGVNKETVKSVEVPVRVLSDSLEDSHKDSGGEFKANANVLYFIDLFSDSKVNEVELRVTVSDTGKRAFKTIEKFFLNDSGKIEISPESAKEACHECLVTRFMMAME
jgi:hypothetical protein